jgi:hypothetical protein
MQERYSECNNYQYMSLMCVSADEAGGVWSSWIKITKLSLYATECVCQLKKVGGEWSSWIGSVRMYSCQCSSETIRRKH